MKTKLISLAIALLSLASVSIAQNEIMPFNPNLKPVLQGSLLCGDEVKRVSYVSDSLNDKWHTDTKIMVDTLEGEIAIHIHFSSPLPYVKMIPVKTDSVVSVLNPYLPINIYQSINSNKVGWNLNEFFYLDNVLVESRFFVNEKDLQEINPFQNCYSVISECDKIKVLRKQRRAICPSYSVYTKYNITTKTYHTTDVPSSFSESFVVLDVEDSIVNQPYTCLAIGNRVVVDTINVNTPLASNVDLKINEVVEHVVTCITIPCNPQKYKLNYYSEKFILPSCIKTGIENGHFTNELVYPNPATDKLFVKGATKITLTNVMGSKLSYLGDGEFNLNGLNSGLYLVTYEINGENYSTKILIQ